MQISINIKDETELKEQIREMVSGFIKQMAREEAEKIFHDEILRLLHTLPLKINESKMDEMLSMVANEKVKSQLGTTYWNTRSVFIETQTVNLIKELVPKQLEKLKFETMVKVAIEDAKKDAIKKLLGEK